MMDKGERTRARVLDTAVALVNRNGIRNTSISDIINGTGVKKGNLYFHFPGKDGLCMAILQEARDRHFDYLAKSVKSDDPLGKISEILDAVLRHHRRARFVGGCIFGNTALETADGGGQYAAFIKDVFDRWTGMLAGILEEAAAAGRLPRGVEPGPMARHIVASLEGSIMMARLYKKAAPIEECIRHIERALGMEKRRGGTV